MDEHTADAFVNRDEPIPSLSFPGTSNTPPPDFSKRKRERFKDSISGTTSKLKEKAQDIGSQGNKDYGYSLQERLLTK